jgi:hypothetical protein
VERDEKLIIPAIEKPLRGIYRDEDYDDRDVYYKLPSHKRFYIKVVVKFDSQNDGTVITAYRCAKIKRTENLIWTS